MNHREAPPLGARPRPVDVVAQRHAPRSAPSVLRHRSGEIAYVGCAVGATAYLGSHAILCGTSGPLTVAFVVRMRLAVTRQGTVRNVLMQTQGVFEQGRLGSEQPRLGRHAHRRTEDSILSIMIGMVPARAYQGKPWLLVAAEDPNNIHHHDRNGHCDPDSDEACAQRGCVVSDTRAEGCAVRVPVRGVLPLPAHPGWTAPLCLSWLGGGLLGTVHPARRQPRTSRSRPRPGRAKVGRPVGRSTLAPWPGPLPLRLGRW
jgi:hypothetical protein